MSYLRDYAQADLSACTRLVQDFFNYHRRLKGSDDLMVQVEAERICQRWAAINTLLVYEHDGAIIGFIRLRKDGQTYWIEDIGIDERSRGQGHGKQVIAALEVWLGERGQSSLFVFVLPENASAVDFYVSNGFTSLNMLELRKDTTTPKPESSLMVQGRRFSLNWQSSQLRGE